MVLISFMVCLYYNVIVMYGMYYLLVSLVYMDGDLPWAECGNNWNTDYCVKDMPDLTNRSEWEKINVTLSKTMCSFIYEASMSTYCYNTNRLF